MKNYICNSEDNIEITYKRAYYDAESEKIISPLLLFNDKKVTEIQSHIYTEDLTLCFLKCCMRGIGILAWGLLPLIIITLYAGQYAIYLLIIDLGFVGMMAIKILFEYRKYGRVKRKLVSYRENVFKEQ